MNDTSSTMSPPYGGDQDRGPAMLAIFWVFGGLSIIIICMRFYSRWVIKKIGADDWAMLLTVFTLLAYCSFITAYALYGGGRHVYYLSQDPWRLMQVIKLNWLSQPWAIMSLGLGKISVAFLMLRLVGPFIKIRRLFLWALIVLTFLFSAIASILTFVQCNPVSALWDKQPGDTCWDPSIQDNFSMFLGSWNTLVDFILAVLPVSIVWNIKIDIKKKVGLSVLLGLGLIACICAAIKTAHLSSLTARSDLTWDTFDLLVWTACESFLLIVCGSASTMRPLLDVIRGRNPLRYSGYNSSGRGADRYGNGRASFSQRQAASNKLASINRENTINRAKVVSSVSASNTNSDVNSDDWPLSPSKRSIGGIQQTIEFDVIHESPPSLDESERSEDGGFGKNGFHYV